MTEIQKWEYTTKFFGHERRIDLDELNKLGEKGWELVAIAGDNDFNGRYIFKRPILSPTTINHLKNKCYELRQH